MEKDAYFITSVLRSNTVKDSSQNCREALSVTDSGIENPIIISAISMLNQNYENIISKKCIKICKKQSKLQNKITFCIYVFDGKHCPVK